MKKAIITAAIITGAATLSSLAGQQVVVVTAYQPNYQNACQMCHGPDGKGDGPVSKLLPVKTPDWSKSLPGYFSKSSEIYSRLKGMRGKTLKIKSRFRHFTSRLSPEELKKMALFIKKYKGLPLDKMVHSPAYDNACAFCHGVIGNGVGQIKGFANNPHDFRDDQIQKFSSAQWITRLKKSQKKVIRVNKGIPHYRSSLKDAHLKSIAEFMSLEFD